MLRERGEDGALQAIAVMQQGEVVDLDVAVATRAAKLGLEYKLPLADSVLLASAGAHDADLRTQDVEFASVPGVRYRPTPRA